MVSEKFPNHDGGVLRVQHAARWGSVPEALLEDPRLALDTRAVASWLAIKPNGWKILVGVLQHRLGAFVHDASSEKPVYRLLSKDRWQRIAKELEATGYLKRSLYNSASGRWTWSVVFNPCPVETDAAVAGFSGDGPSIPGSSRAGATGAGKSSNKGKPSKSKQTTATTTTTADNHAPGKRQIAGGRRVDLLIESVAKPHADLLLRLLSNTELPDIVAQQIVDEFTGVMEAAASSRHKQITSVRGWITKMIRSYENGSFAFDFGRAVEARRNSKHPLSVPQAERSDHRVAVTHLDRMRSSLRRSKLNESVPPSGGGDPA